METPTRRTVLKGAAVLAGAAAVQASLPAAAAQAGGGHRAKAGVLLVHGAWVDGSSWNQVTAILQRWGHTVLAVQLPMTGLPDDIAWTRHVLAERMSGPTVMAGHSYGGAVISGAATGLDQVIGLVFASAFAPDQGETLGGLNAGFPAPPGLAFTQPDSQGFLWFDPAAIPANFAPDIPLADARVLAATQKPIAARSFADVAGPPAWRTKPSWALVSTQDRMINPDLERFMAARAHATTIEVRSGHASPASHPREVAGLIRAAARAAGCG